MLREWKAEVKLTVRDIFYFLLRHSFSTWQGKVTWILGFLALIGAPIMFLKVQDNFSGAVFLVVAVIYLVISPFALYSNAKRQMISNSVFKNKIFFRFREEMIHVKQYTGEVELFWHQMIRIDLSRHYFYLYVNPSQAFIIPKQAFDESDISEVIELLEKKRALIVSGKAEKPELIPSAMDLEVSKESRGVGEKLQAKLEIMREEKSETATEEAEPVAEKEKMEMVKKSAEEKSPKKSQTKKRTDKKNGNNRNKK